MAGYNLLSKLGDQVTYWGTFLNISIMAFFQKIELKRQIMTERKKIQNLYITIGDGIYEMWENDNININTISSHMQEIKSAKSKINGLELKSSEIDRKNAEVLGDIKAKAKLRESVEQKEECAKIICPKCKEQYETAVKFCRKCGTQLQE